MSMSNADWEYEDNLIEVETTCAGCGEPLTMQGLPSEADDIEHGYQKCYCWPCIKKGMKDG